MQAVRAARAAWRRSRDELAVVPDDAVEPVVGFLSHGVPPPSRWTGVLRRLNRLTVVYAFASGANTRYVSLAHESALARPAQRLASWLSGTILSAQTRS